MKVRLIEDMKKTVKHLYKTVIKDGKTAPVTIERLADVKTPVAESLQDVMGYCQNREDILVASMNAYWKIQAQRTANNALLGMSSGNKEIRSALKDFKNYLKVSADPEMLEEGETLESIADNLLTKKRFVILKPVVDAANDSSTGKIQLDYTGSVVVKISDKDGKDLGESTLPALRPKLAFDSEGKVILGAVTDDDDDDDDEEEEKTEEKPQAKRGRK